MPDTTTWAVTAGTLTFTIDAEGRAHVDAEGRLTAPRGRCWTLSLVTDTQRDLAVHSEDQSPQVHSSPAELVLTYPRVTAVDGSVHEVNLTVRVRDENGTLTFDGTVAAERVTVAEVTLPVLELAADTVTEDETLYRPEGLGRRIHEPRSRLYRAHTEYMDGDDTGVWEEVAYPGEMSMAWQGVQWGEQFLYLGQHDPEFTSVLFGSGVPPRGVEGELWFSATTPIWASQGSIPPVVLTLLDGGWRAGARTYRTWAEGWYTGPHPSTRPIRGWQRIIMRHQFGKVLFRYDDLVDVYEAGRRAGLDGILLFGWWKGGFDRGYPTYEVDEELGGAEGLSAAIAEIESRGGYVALYANGNLIDRSSAFARAHAAEVTKKDLTGLTYIPGYAFADESHSLRKFTANAFEIACHGAPRWREEMADVARIQASFGTRHVFFDQTAYHLTAWPCGDTRHEHGDEAGNESRYRRLTLDGIRTASNAESLGSEGMADMMIPALNYHHGWGFAFQDEPEAFPALFRSVFPEPYVSNRLIHDQRDGWRDQLNYAFVYHLFFDVAIHRSRETLAAYPEYEAHIQRLVALRNDYASCFDEGDFAFVDDANGLTHVRYTAGTQSIDVLWNRTDEPVASASRTVPAHEVLVLERAGE